MASKTAVRLAALAMLAGGCAAGSDDEPELTRRFTARPIEVAASSEFDADCMLAIADAASFFRDRNVTIVVHSADPLTTPALNGVAQAGVIAILPGAPSMRPGELAHGETSLALTIGGDILGAEIVLASCDVRVVAHELAHGLGLEHVRARGNLMHAELELGGWELTDEQLWWVADP